MASSSGPNGQPARRYCLQPRRYASRPARRSRGERSFERREGPSSAIGPNGRKEASPNICRPMRLMRRTGRRIGACRRRKRLFRSLGDMPAKTVPHGPYSLKGAERAGECKCTRWAKAKTVGHCLGALCCAPLKNGAQEIDVNGQTRGRSRTRAAACGQRGKREKACPSQRVGKSPRNV